MDPDDVGEDCKILVVDDNVEAADTLVSLLDLLGFKAYAVYGGEEAVLVAEALRPKLVLLDIDMPGLDGYGTASCIRHSQEEREVELIALTAHNSPTDRVMSSSVGFDLHVQKPIGSKQLWQLARKACTRK